MSSEERLKQVYRAESAEELAKAYDGWAADYDDDLTAFGYKNPAVAAGLIGRYLAPSARILDAGCGPACWARCWDGWAMAICTASICRKA